MWKNGANIYVFVGMATLLSYAFANIIGTMLIVIAEKAWGSGVDKHWTNTVQIIWMLLAPWVLGTWRSIEGVREMLESD